LHDCHGFAFVIGGFSLALIALASQSVGWAKDAAPSTFQHVSEVHGGQHVLRAAGGRTEASFSNLLT
jgi:hypothetical protein